MATNVFDKYRSGNDYNWFQDYLLERDVQKSQEAKGIWGSKKKSGQDIGGALGGLLGTYALPALVSMIPGMQGPAIAMAASAMGSTLGTMGFGALGGATAGAAPDTGLGYGETEDLQEQFKDALSTQGMQAGLSTAGTALEMGQEDYQKHLKKAFETPIIDRYKHTVEKFKNVDNWGKFLMPGGESGIYQGQPGIDYTGLDHYQSKKDYEAQLTEAEKYDEYGRLIGGGKAYGGTGLYMDDITDWEADWMPEEGELGYDPKFGEADYEPTLRDYYEYQTQIGNINPNIAGAYSNIWDPHAVMNQSGAWNTPLGGLIPGSTANWPAGSTPTPYSDLSWDLQLQDPSAMMISERPSDWESMLPDEQQAWESQWGTDFRTWEDELMAGMPESAFISQAPHSVMTGPWFTQGGQPQTVPSAVTGYAYGRNPQIQGASPANLSIPAWTPGQAYQTGGKGLNQPIYNTATGQWEW